MTGAIRSALRRVRRHLRTRAPREPSALVPDLTPLQLQIGALLARQLRTQLPIRLADAEFKVFSQFGEDGIIQFLIAKVGYIPPTFVEFGVQDYREANTRFLLMHDNWRGLIMDGSESAIHSVRQQDFYWRHDLRALSAFIDRDNVNSLIAQGGMRGEIGLLSIDIDGNDYWVWERIDVVAPAIVVAEYNSVFGARRAVSIPYAADFQRTLAHTSNLYWGCSLPALCHLAAKKGYVFVGSNRAGNNAFFVRRGYDSALMECSAAEGYVESRFRESRDERGALTYLSGTDRLAPIAHLPLVDVTTGTSLQVGDLRED